MGSGPVEGRHRRVLIVGQIARDLVLRVPQAPGAGGSSRVRERLEMLGGKGANQAVGMAQLGLDPILVGVVGDDEIGRALIADARHDGIDVAYVVRRPGTRTGLIVSVVDGDGWRYCEDLPQGVLVTPDDLDAVVDALASVGTVVLQLQQPGPTLRRAAELGRRAGARVVLDGVPPEEDGRELLGLADVVRADDREAVRLAAIAGVPIRGEAVQSAHDALRAARAILEFGPSFAAVAAGPDGNAFAWREGELVIPFRQGPVVDTTGAGDALVAALVAAFAEGQEPPVAARWAAEAATLAVQHLGGRPALTRQQFAPHATPSG